MKTAIALSVLLSAPAWAGVVARDGPSVEHGVIVGSGARRREVIDILYARANTTVCNADNVLRDLRNPTRSAAASVFCPGYIQPTITVTSIQTITAATVTVSSTETDTAIANTASTCAAIQTPGASPLTCGFHAYGFGQNLLSQTFNVQAEACHEQCLANPACKSFQTQEGGNFVCNLYNTVTAGNVSPNNDIYVFFDRDCPDFLPADCTPTPAPPAPTVAPVKRDVASTPSVLQSVLATVPASRISSACSCFIGSGSLAATAGTTVSDFVTATVTEVTTTVVIIDPTPA